jgi:hypothetical protein
VQRQLRPHAKSNNWGTASALIDKSTRLGSYIARYIAPARIAIPSGIVIVSCVFGSLFRFCCSIANIVFMLQASFLAAAIVELDTVPL